MSICQYFTQKQRKSSEESSQKPGLEPGLASPGFVNLNFEELNLFLSGLVVIILGAVVLRGKYY